MTTGLLAAVDAMQGRRILVIGEAMLDSYLRGHADRLSREAPVPVVALDRRVDSAGGAANSAANLAALGASVTLLSVVGSDEEGERLCGALLEAGLDTDGVLRDPDRRTLTKQRVVADGQVLLRFDSGTIEGISASLEDELIERIEALVPEMDAVLVSDYSYGVVGPRIDTALAESFNRTRPVVVVDARDPSRHARLAPTATKPNYGEAVRLLGEQELEGSEARARQIVAGAETLHRRTGSAVVAVTLDREGAVILEQGRQPYRTYARPTADQQACGAGDTYSGVLALGLAAGAPTPVAAELAAAAAGVVVQKDGTAICTAADLAAAVGRSEKRLQSIDEVRARVELLREQGRRIVFTNGCFDILHRGHVTYLSRAKALGDVLLVGVNSDASVRGLKGTDRPINRLEDRLSVLEALSCIDHVIPFEAATPAALIAAIRPDVFVKGGDYRRETLPEAPLVERLGGTVRILSYVQDYSTTSLIHRVRAVDQTEALRQ
ncbi:MAG TPA: D-glycero-beta-D-manno-heptose 1-phosphate adenylyltransferase [Candidatus Limnocylindrales bacterium]|nr:D-glycero-beta-D-manno-heptose 1-phosphate adenylyltransferase [Candidatus Limnocylindrales bacterium]